MIQCVILKLIQNLKMNTTQKHTTLIKTEAQRLGFLSCGISKAEFLDQEAPRLEKWLNKNMHGEMHYMENHFDKRLDPTKLVEGSKSVVSLLLNYYPSDFQKDNLALSYRLSGNNGMPWGKWNPSYIPVGFSEESVTL